MNVCFPYMYARSVASSVQCSCFISEKCASSVQCSHFNLEKYGKAIFVSHICVSIQTYASSVFRFCSCSFLQLLRLFVKQACMCFTHLFDMLLPWYPRTLVLQRQQSKDWCQLSTATIYTFSYSNKLCTPIWWILDQSQLLKVECFADLSTKLSLVKVYFWVLLGILRLWSINVSWHLTSRYSLQVSIGQCLIIGRLTKA